MLPSSNSSVNNVSSGSKRSSGGCLISSDNESLFSDYVSNNDSLFSDVAP